MLFQSINSLPLATISPSGTLTMCSGQSMVLNGGTSTGQTYQWQKNNVNISGATKSNYTASNAGTYRLKVTNSSACANYSPVADIVINCKSADSSLIEKQEMIFLEDVTVFPNPSSVDFTIALNHDDVVPVSIIAHDIAGRVVFNKEFSSDQRITFGERFDEGIYFVRLQYNGFQKVIKVIKANLVN